MWRMAAAENGIEGEKEIETRAAAYLNTCLWVQELEVEIRPFVVIQNEASAIQHTGKRGSDL